MPETTARSLTLMSWGLLLFEVWPLNYHELDHRTAADWARKEIAGAPIYREYVGEGDEELHFRGRVFPFRLGGLDALDMMDSLRRAGTAEAMVRSDGVPLGWYVIERLVRSHQYISMQGIGRQINFEANFARVPTPAADEHFARIFRMAAT